MLFESYSQQRDNSDRLYKQNGGNNEQKPSFSYQAIGLIRPASLFSAPKYTVKSLKILYGLFTAVILIIVQSFTRVSLFFQVDAFKRTGLL